MKKSTVRATIIIVVAIIGLLGVYMYLTQKARERSIDPQMSQAQILLGRDLQNNYPPTVKEVIKYYTEIERCFYDASCTEEEIEQLGLKARELYDDELLENNDVAQNISRLKADIEAFQNSGKKLTGVSIAASTNVETFTEDGYEFARIYCAYSYIENSRTKFSGMVYLLRRDENRRWKIYGWDLAENVNVSD